MFLEWTEGHCLRKKKCFFRFFFIFLFPIDPWKGSPYKSNTTRRERVVVWNLYLPRVWERLRKIYIFPWNVLGNWKLEWWVKRWRRWRESFSSFVGKRTAVIWEESHVYTKALSYILYLRGRLKDICFTPNFRILRIWRQMRGWDLKKKKKVFICVRNRPIESQWSESEPRNYGWYPYEKLQVVARSSDNERLIRNEWAKYEGERNIW